MSKPSTFLLFLLVCRQQHCICYHLTGGLSQQQFTLEFSLGDLYYVQYLQENSIFIENFISNYKCIKGALHHQLCSCLRVASIFKITSPIASRKPAENPQINN